jgi:hypothetical protein
MMGVINEGLHDTSWENEKGDKVTLIDLLDITKDIPVQDISVEELKPYLLSWNNDPEEIVKIERADLQYPVLIFVTSNGEFISIIDGHHRAQKAVKNGLETINAKVINIDTLPKHVRNVFSHLVKQEEITEDEELNERCWKGYTQKGMKTMFGKRYPNCVKKKNKSLKEYWTPKEEDYSNIESAINKIIPKSFSWFKEIEINNISYSEFSNTLTIYGELKVDEEWGAKQWREYYEYKPFPSNSGWEEEDPVRLGDIIGKGELDDLNDELELILSSVGGYSIIDTMRLGQLKLYFV